MKCKKCIFTYCDSYEYQIYYCIFFGEEPSAPFCTEDGCKLKYKEAKKLYKLRNNCENNIKTRKTAKTAFEKYFKYYKELEKKYEK